MERLQEILDKIYRNQGVFIDITYAKIQVGKINQLLQTEKKQEVAERIFEIIVCPILEGPQG